MLILILSRKRRDCDSNEGVATVALDRNLGVVWSATRGLIKRSCGVSVVAEERCAECLRQRGQGSDGVVDICVVDVLVVYAVIAGGVRRATVYR